MKNQDLGAYASETARARTERARAIAAAGGIEQALAKGALPRRIDTTLSESVVLGLLRQRVTRFLCVLGHGSTEIGEVLRIYHGAGLLKTYNVRHETAASHAAAALRWTTGERAAVSWCGTSGSSAPATSAHRPGFPTATSRVISSNS